jgi:ribonuclease E
MSPRERRNHLRKERKRRQEEAKARRRAIREEGRRRRAGLPVAEQPATEVSSSAAVSDEPEPSTEASEASEASDIPEAPASGDDSAPEPINTDDFADVGADSAAAPAEPANLSRKERRELRKRRREEMREAAKRERQRALADDRGETGDDADGAESPDAVDAEPEGTEAAPEAAEMTSAEQENDVPEPTSEETEAPAVPIEPQTAAEQSAADRIKAAEAREEKALIEASEQEASATADRRVREVHQIQRVAEHGGPAQAAPAGSPAWSPGDERDEEGHPIAPFSDELRATEEHIRRRRQRDQELVEELDATEVRIGETRERTQAAIEDAQRRLEEIQAQAAEAEERAARAEQIAEYKQAEAEREHHLLEMLEKINDAERRAREAEAKARRAVAEVARPFEALKAPEPLPPDAPASIEDLKSRPFDPDAPEAEGGVAEPDPDGPLNINQASFEQLRAIGMSVTQVGRLLAVRERTGGFNSVEELDSIPGFPREFLDSVRDQLTV